MLSRPVGRACQQMFLCMLLQLAEPFDLQWDQTHHCGLSRWDLLQLADICLCDAAAAMSYGPAAVYGRILNVGPFRAS